MAGKLLGPKLESATRRTIAKVDGQRIDKTSGSGNRDVRFHRSARQFRYKSMGGDYIICRAWDGITEGSTDVKIAKPYLLRRSTPARAGYAYLYSNDVTRVSTYSGTTENQAIWPQFVVNDLIYADRPLGGTGVTVSGENLVWCDTNRDGRLWMKV